MLVKCSMCQHENVSGVDRCEECLHSLMQKDLPRPKRGDSIQRTLMTTPIYELLTGKDLLVADPGDTVQKAVDILRKERKNCILVYENKKLVGILSNSNLLHKVAGKIKDLTSVKIKDVMTVNPEFVLPEDTIAVVVNKMAMGGFRHVPVLDKDGTPLSILTIKDVIFYITSKNRPS
ncbi:MAG: CBS domain-containing protein [Chlamydiota bacterium]|nr:CBS domain-containing protein [Chlamydiota bacterium]